MDSKFSVIPTVRDHYCTLVDHNDHHWYWPDYVVILGLPAAGGAAVGYFYQLRDMASYIGGTAVFSALLFGMVVFVFQLRMQLVGNPYVSRDGELTSFIDQLFANVNYAVVVGVLATAAGMAAAVTASADGHVDHVWSGVVVALGLHLMLVVFMCVKRIRAAYREIRALPQTARL